MVRETRHLWVGNLPENVSKERIKEYFNRYGPVQSVKPLPGKDGAGEAATAVTVAFMDIKSACKALQTPHKLDERVLKTDFYDPASGACGSGSCPPAPEEKGGGPGGGGPPSGPKGTGEVARPVGGGGHWRHGGHQDNQGGRDYQNRNNHQARYQDPDQFRHRSRMPYRNGNFGQDGVRGNATYRNNYGWKDSRGRESQYGGPTDKQEPQPRLLPGNKVPVNSNPTSTSAVNTINPGVGKKKQRARKSKSSESGSDSQQSGSNSRSSSSSSSRSSSSASGSSKSPSPDRRASKRTGGGMQGGNFLPHTEFDKQCTVVVRNLPERPAEAAVKEELNREYKKGGCVIREVRVVDKKREGGVTRTAIITFSDPADVSKALEDSRNKRILGSLIDVEKLNSHSDDRTSREGEYSEFHNRATRTLFVGNISREVVPSEIHERFKEFGEILEIDIKKPDYALVQFVDIKSVVKAMRGMSSEMIAGQRVRLGFGLSVATKCVWCDGVGAEVTEKMLQVEFSQYGKIQDLIVDRSRGHALVYFDQLKKATIAVKEMRGRSIMGCRLQTDYASHECRAAFFDHCKKSGMDIRERAKPWEQDQNPGDKRDRVERKPRERSTESRGSGAGSGRARKRDEYDEELRRFQSERGKFDETERCFTPPYGGVRRSVPSTGGPSRSPSPLPRSTRSPGQQSRSGHDRSAFSDRESVVSDSSRHGSPVSREGWRGSRYKPRVQAISPPGDSRSPADHDDTRRGSKRYREEERRSGGRPQDPRVSDHVTADKKHFKLGGVDSGLSEETSSGSSGSVPDVDNAKLPGARGPNSVKQLPNRRTSTDSASASMDGSSRPATPSMTLPFATGGPSLLRVAATEEGYTAPRTPVSPPPSSDGSRPGTPLCDENPENLMSRSAAAPVRLASHLRTQNNSSEPMSLPLPRFAHVLSTSPGDRPRPQISPRDSREAPPTQPGLLKHSTRPDLAKLSILSPTKFPNGPPEPPRARDPRLKSPAGEPSPAPTPSLKSPVSVPGGTKQATFLSPGSSTPTTPVQPSPGHKPKDPRPPAGGLLAVAIPTVVAASPLSPLPRPVRNPQEGSEPMPSAVVPDIKPAAEAGPLELEERLKLLDEKYQSWSSLTRVSGSGPGREAGGGRFNLDIKPAQPSAIVQKLLSRKSVFDEDSKRLENINEKYDASEEENGEGGTGGQPPAAGYNTISTLPLKTSMQEPSPSSELPIGNPEPVLSTMIVRDLPTVPPMLPGSPVKVAALHRPSMSPRMYLPQVQSPKTLDESSRPLPLPYRAGTPATMGSNPIKPLVDKLSKPAAFTKPSATVTPTLKSTGLTASTSVRSNVFTTTSTKTVSTCTMAPGNISHSHIGVEKGEASSTTCSPKPDSALMEVTSSPTLQPPPQETDSDPNVTSTTGTEQKKKQEANRDIRTMKKELDSLTSLKEKRDLGEELLFAPSATIMQAKTKYEKSEKKKPSSGSAHDILKDVKRAKESLQKDKIKSNREKKDKMKVKQKNDLKDFLSATATIRKEAKKEEARKDEKRDQPPDMKKQDAKTEDKPMQKRRLSSNSEIEEAEPKSKIAKLKVEGECEPEVKKLKSEPMTPMGRIPKLAKKEPERKETPATVRSLDGSKDRSKLSSYSKVDSKPKSRHDDRHGHRLSSSGDKGEDRKRDKHKKKKKEKDKEREKEDKLKKQDKSKSRSHSTDDERHHKKLKKSKDSKKKDDKDRLPSKGDKKDKLKREEKEKDRAREKNMSKEEREKEKAKRRHKEMVEEQRKIFEQLRKKKKLENGNGDSDGDDSSGDEANFSIFDEPVFDENNPIYFSMYDKVKARRSCVKAKEEEEARRQEEALNKFAKLKAQRAKREGKKKSVDSDDDSLDEDEIGHPRNSSPLNSEDGTGGSLNKKNSSLLNSSSDSEDELNGQVKRESKMKSGNASNDERKRSFKSKPRALDSSDEESPSGSRKPRSKLHPGLDSSESDELAENEKKSESKPLRKLPIYSDSDSENDSVKNSHSKLSGSDSEVTDSKASALAVLAMNKKKLDIKQEVKNEPVSSDGETEPTDSAASALADFASIKKEIKLEDGVEQKLHKKKAHHVKKEKKREREHKEVGKEKSLLGQKLKMAKIFGTSSEDEGNSRNSKPPTPNTSGGKTSLAKSTPKSLSRSHMTRMEVVNFSDHSDSEKRLDSPALMSDSDDDVPSRPPTPTFPAAKTGAKPQEQTKAKEQVEVKEVVKNEEVQINKDEGKSILTNESSEDELLSKEAKYDTEKEQERNRRLSAHDRQKESENLFDSLLTVNVDLPAKSTSWKSPGGSLKSPNVKSPNKVSPGSSRTPNSGSPGSHRSPLVSPGGKPTYLLAHMFGGGDRSAREAEKIHRAQEREMHKKGSDRITKETFKTKKDLDDASSTKKQDEGRLENATGEKMVTEEKNQVETKEKEPVQDTEQGKKKSEPKLNEKSLPSSVSPKEVEVEKEVKAKMGEPVKTKEDLKPKEKKTRTAEDGFGDRKSGRDRSKEEKKLLEVNEPKVKTGGTRTSVTGKEKEEEQHKRAVKKSEGALDQTRPEVTETQPKLAKAEGTNDQRRGPLTQDAPSSKDSVFDFKDEVEVVGTLKPASSFESSKSKFSKGCEKSLPVVVEVPTTPPASPTATLPCSSSYASFAASTKIEATSSPGPASEDDDTPLLIIADDSEVTEVTPDDEEVTEVKQNVDESKLKVCSIDEVENAEDTGTAIVVAKSTTSSNAKQLKSSESSEQEQLEKSIASITGDARRDTVDSMDTETAALTTTVEQKRTVISQEETENAINALLGESFESFEPEPEPVEPEPAAAGRVEPIETTREDDEAAAAVAGLADADEAASAVLGLAEAGDWHTNVSKQQEDESIENIAAEIRRSSTESLRRFSTESSKSGEEPNKTEEKIVLKAPETKKTAAVEEIPKPVKSQTEETPANLETPTQSKSVESNEKKQAEDVFDFKVDEEPTEPLKAVDRQKQTAAVEQLVEPLVEEAKTSSEEVPVVPAKVGTARESMRSKAQPIQSSQVVQQPQLAQTTASSPMPATVTSPSSAVGRESPLVLQRLSTEEKSSTPLPLASPNLPLASPNSVKSPKPRTRRSTGGKSRESEEESPDTLQKINLILEQAKQEAERSQAHQSQTQHQLVSLPVPFRPTEGGALLAAQPGAPVQDLLIDPKTGQVVGRQSAPNSVTLTLVTSTAQDQPQAHQHPADLRVAVAPPRTGVPQPTVLPPRHDQQVRPAVGPVPRVVAAAPRPPRPPLPIQLPTQPLPPESVRKAQPVLLEQNPQSKLVQSRQTPLPVSLPTEPVPRSVAAASQMPNLPRTPLPFSSAAMVSSSHGAALRLITTHSQSRAQPAPGWQPSSAPRPQSSIQETGQRVSLNKRDKDPELETKPATETGNSVGQPGPLKLRGDYLQPRDREINRPASTPLSTPSPMVASQHQYEVPAAHLASSAAQYEAELVRLASYRDLTLIYQQLLSQGHPEHVAQNMAQSILRERYDTYRHEEARPGSVPPTMAMHHMEEQMRRQQMPQSVRQPLPAHTSQVEAYRQTESPHQAVYMGAHPAYQTHPSHLDSYRRPGLGPEPPAAHSGQSVARLTQSPSVSDYSISRPSSPTYNPSVSDYRLPHLAAYPICWSGTLGLKNDMANVRMHYVSGNRDLAKASLPDTGSTLKIVQRMRLEDSQLDGVARKMETKSEHCMLLALPNGSEHEEIEHQSKILRSNFITYLQLKSAAGIVNVSNEDNQPAYIVHVFPSCDFANENLARIAPNLLHRVADIEHLVIVIATVFDVNR